MANPEWYTPSGSPGQSSGVNSPPMRGEFLAIGALTDKLPTLNGAQDNVIVVNAAGNALTSITKAELLSGLSTGIAGITSSATGTRLSLTNDDMAMGTAGADFTIRHAATNRFLRITGHNSSAAGGEIRLYGSSHLTKANDYEVWSQGSLVGGYDNSLSYWNFQNKHIHAGHFWSNASDNARLVLHNTGHAVNNRITRLVSSETLFKLAFLNSEQSIERNILSSARSGYDVSSVTLGNTANYPNLYLAGLTTVSHSSNAYLTIVSNNGFAALSIGASESNNSHVLFSNGNGETARLTADNNKRLSVRADSSLNNAFRFQSYQEANSLVGASVADYSGTLRPVGFNIMRTLTENSSVNICDEDNVSCRYNKSSGSATYTANQNSNVPVGSIWMITNSGGGALNIAQDSGVTLTWYDIGGLSAGNRVLAVGGVATLIKVGSTSFNLWGSGIS